MCLLTRPARGLRLQSPGRRIPHLLAGRGAGCCQIDKGTEGSLSGVSLSQPAARAWLSHRGWPPPYKDQASGSRAWVSGVPVRGVSCPGRPNPQGPMQDLCASHSPVS